MSIAHGDTRVLVSLPNSPKIVYPAVMTFYPGEAISLAFHFLGEPPTWFQEDRVPCFQVVSPEPATIWNNLKVNSQYSADFVSAQYLSTTAILGACLTEDQQKFSEISMELVGVGAWFPVSNFNFPGDRDFAKKILLEYIPDKDRFWEIRDGSVEIGYGTNVNLNMNFRPNKDLSLNVKTFIKIRTKIPLEVEDLVRHTGKFQNFVELCSSGSYPTGAVYVYALGSEDPLELVAKWKRPSYVEHSNFPFVHFDHVQENFGLHLSKWDEMYSMFPLAIDSYSICKKNPSLPIEFRLFSICSALESLHNNLFPEKQDKNGKPIRPSFEQRLKDLVQAYGHFLRDHLKVEDCEKIAATRNYLAHQTADLRRRSFPEKDWFFLYRNITAAFEICLLCQLPFMNPQAIEKVVDQRWNQIKNGALGEWEFRSGES